MLLKEGTRRITKFGATLCLLPCNASLPFLDCSLIQWEPSERRNRGEAERRSGEAGRRGFFLQPRIVGGLRDGRRSGTGNGLVGGSVRASGRRRVGGGRGGEVDDLDYCVWARDRPRHERYCRWDDVYKPAWPMQLARQLTAGRASAVTTLSRALWPHLEASWTSGGRTGRRHALPAAAFS